MHVTEIEPVRALFRWSSVAYVRGTHTATDGDALIAG
jgi:hypothetical protein